MKIKKNNIFTINVFCMLLCTLKKLTNNNENTELFFGCNSGFKKTEDVH